MSNAVQVFRNAASTKPAPLPDNNTFATEYVTSTVAEPHRPISSGLFRVEKGGHSESTYDFHEVKYIIEGEFNIQIGNGQRFVARAGDIIHFPKGCKAVFSSNTYGLAFYAAQRAGQSTVNPDSKL